MFGMLEEVYVHELLDLERRRGNVLDYVGEERQGLRGRLSVGHLRGMDQLVVASCHRRKAPHRDNASQSLEHISFGATVEQFLKLARGQHLGGGLGARIGGIAGGFEGQVPGCSERPVSIVRRVHG